MPFLKSPPARNLPEVMGREPEVAEPFYLLVEAIMRGPSPFSPGERELIAAYVSALNGCEYCHQSHQAVAEAFGIEKGLVEPLLDDLERANVPERLRAALAYARKLTEDPAGVTEADVDAALAGGLEEKALYDVVMVTGLFNMANRFMDGFGIPAQDPRHLAQAVRHMQEKGYAAAIAFLQKR